MLSSARPPLLPRPASSRRSDSVSRDLQSLPKDWERTLTADHRIPTPESILNQSVPLSLATPAGWHSEILHGSASSMNELQASRVSTDRKLVEKYEEYKTINSFDAPPMIFSSSSEANRVVDEIPSAAILSSRNFSPKYDYSQETFNSSATRERYEIPPETQRSPVLEDTDVDQPPPLVLHKRLANDQVTYQQNISVKYLQPPTPPPSGPIIIRQWYLTRETFSQSLCLGEVRPPPPAPASPIQVRLTLSQITTNFCLLGSTTSTACSDAATHRLWKRISLLSLLIVFLGHSRTPTSASTSPTSSSGRKTASPASSTTTPYDRRTIRLLSTETTRCGHRTLATLSKFWSAACPRRTGTGALHVRTELL